MPPQIAETYQTGGAAYLWKLDNKVVWHFHCVVEIVKYLGKFPLI